MELTDQQKKIVSTKGNLKINAVAGSGKTSTMIEYAKRQSKSAKILYLAFNKSVKLEAIDKFKKHNLNNVTVETAHSLAYKNILKDKKYKIRQTEYKPYDLIEILKLSNGEDPLFGYIIANHIKKFTNYFCCSNKSKVAELNYLDTISDEDSKKIVNIHYQRIEKQTRIFLAKMDSGEIEITHDFYLKKFQLSNPKLDYDFILFDEAQDASPAMLDIFLKQNHATKVIVGDTHQQIYSWRYAINSLECVDFKAFNLSTSFRFNQEIANFANEILAYKNYIKKDCDIKIIGKSIPKPSISKAFIARTNLGLLTKAIEFITNNDGENDIYFEGNISSYTYAETGASLYDVLNLFNKKPELIQNKIIKKIKDFNELEDFATKIEDVELMMMIDLVKIYEKDLPKVIKKLKERHIKDDNKNSAKAVFTTVHRGKGMEYDTIEIVEDFIAEDTLLEIDFEGKKTNLNKLNEEINLLYVAVTRAKQKVIIPKKLVPKKAINCKSIFVVETDFLEETQLLNLKNDNAVFTKNYQAKFLVEEQYKQNRKSTKNKKPSAFSSFMKGWW